MLQLALAHDKTKKAHSISKQSYKFKQELYIHQNKENDTNTTTKQASDKTVKKEGLKQIKRNWENKPLRGKYPLRSQKADVDQGNAHQWLRCEGLNAETEGFIKAAQDQSLFT